ncbi:MAG: hypothetical protein KDC80_25510 [Saprospiraceae bacterium]|nr:hypothetical protein [Saprospiraceae bacterium]
MTGKGMESRADCARRSNELAAMFSRILLEDIELRLEKHFDAEDRKTRPRWTEDELVGPLFPHWE